MYAATPGSPERGDLIPAALAILSVTTVLLLVAAGAYRDMRKAAVFLSVVLIVFFVVGAAYPTVEEWQIAGGRLVRRRYVVPAVYLSLAAFGFWLIRARQRFVALTAVANIVAVGALLPPAFVLIRHQLTSYRSRGTGAPLPAIAPATPAPQRPDIYYVIFDRYGDERTLRRYGVDNGAFLRYLESRGFFVARESRSNYINTVLSLASSMNMAYLDDVARAQGERSAEWGPLDARIRTHRVGAFLRAQGYEYIHFGSWFASTRDNPQATRNVNYYVTVPKSALRLLDNVLFEPVRQVMATPLLDDRRQHWERIRREVDDAVALASDPGPKFVFLHLLVPHHPYVFDRDGSYVTRHEENRRTRRENYSNQVLAANLLIRRLVDGVLERSASPPIIMLQGDEGPYPAGTENDTYEWTRARPETLRERSGILNAYYLPGDGARSVYSRISPVNSFRVVFNEYLGTRLPLLPDRTILHASDRQPYAFSDATDAIARPRDAPVATTGGRP